MIQAIILAGGKGTRLRSVVADVPKPMASISGKPFLFYLMSFLQKEGVGNFVLAVGYLHEKVSEYFGDNFNGIPITYVVENTPLGTGGGLKFALDACQEEDVLVCNGDTFFDFNLSKLYFAHRSLNSPFTFSVRKIYNTGRFGGMKIDSDAKVKAFSSKDEIGEIYINAGAYLVNKRKFLDTTVHMEKFSLEDEFLVPNVATTSFFAVPFNNSNFLDIGIPEYYEKSQSLIPQWVLKSRPKIETIFLDRDGVINQKIDNDYVRTTEQLRFMEGAVEWIAKQSDKLILVITNQRGVGRGLMSEEALLNIHHFMSRELEKKGGTISKFYYCIAVNSTDICRKPNPGMLEQAARDFESIRKDTTLFIGDSLSDLQAAKAFGCKAVFLTNGKPLNLELLEYSDLIFTQLNEVSI